MKSYYVILSKEFAEDAQGYQEGPNIFSYVITNSGLYVVSTNSLNDFSEIFNGDSFEVIALSPDDFPLPKFSPGGDSQ